MSAITGYIYLMMVCMFVVHLLPKQEYLKYMEVFLCILITVSFLKAVLGWTGKENMHQLSNELGIFYEQLGNIEYKGEGEDIFELFFEANDK